MDLKWPRGTDLDSFRIASVLHCGTFWKDNCPGKIWSHRSRGIFENDPICWVLLVWAWNTLSLSITIVATYKNDVCVYRYMRMCVIDCNSALLSSVVYRQCFSYTKKKQEKGGTMQYYMVPMQLTDYWNPSTRRIWCDFSYELPSLNLYN